MEAEVENGGITFGAAANKKKAAGFSGPFFPHSPYIDLTRRFQNVRHYPLPFDFVGGGRSQLRTRLLEFPV